MPVHYLETGSTDPCYNLALEEYVLEHRRQGDWLLLWQNANTVVIGLNQNAAEEVNASFAAAHGVTVVRRMTGGGAVYHDLGNLNYSFIGDAGDSRALSIRRFAEPVCRALAAMGVEAELSGRNDILVAGKKVSGAAQRITGGRILHHGTLLFDSDPAMITGVLHADPAKFSSKSAKSVRSRVGNIRDSLPAGADLAQFRQRLLQELTRDGLIPETLGDAELAAVRKLADEKYRSWDWTYGRSPNYEYRNRGRFPGGSLEVRMDIRHGLIRDLVFFGDFMATAPLTGLCEALRGTRLRAEAISAVLARFSVPALFGGISEQDVLNLMLNEGEARPDS